MVGWNRRFHAMILEAKKRIEERGPIVQLVGEFHKSLSRFEASGRYSEVFLDNMMWESINHSVDLVRALANSEVVEVNSVVRRASGDGWTFSFSSLARMKASMGLRTQSRAWTRGTAGCSMA